MNKSKILNNIWLMLIIFFVQGISCNSGKTEDLNKIMKKESLKSKLTPLQYHVTQENGTEKPFENVYWNNREPGIYVDIVSGEPLFSSLDKYKSGTGWPSFTRPLEEANMIYKEDNTLFTTRTEVRSRKGDSHLGHVFDDGPPPTNKRYCMNSAALRFIPVKDLEKEGYGKYKNLFAGINNAEDSKYEKAIFAGGCFWCTESDFEKIKGVISVVSGYTGGNVENPTYEQVSKGGTGHAESVLVTFDPEKISYEELLKIYWKSIDPTVKDQQFCDHGSQYRSAIFYMNSDQRLRAEKSKKETERILKKKIYTQVVKAGAFYQAEEYHQDYYKKNPVRYKFYRYRCGRDQRLKEVWGDVEK